MKVLFTFTMDTGTKEAAWAGNVSPQSVLSILQGIVISEQVRETIAKKESGKNAAGEKQDVSVEKETVDKP